MSDQLKRGFQVNREASQAEAKRFADRVNAIFADTQGSYRATVHVSRWAMLNARFRRLLRRNRPATFIGEPGPEWFIPREDGHIIR